MCCVGAAKQFATQTTAGAAAGAMSATSGHVSAHASHTRRAALRSSGFGAAERAGGAFGTAQARGHTGRARPAMDGAAKDTIAGLKSQLQAVTLEEVARTGSADEVVRRMAGLGPSTAAAADRDPLTPDAATEAIFEAQFGVGTRTARRAAAILAAIRRIKAERPPGEGQEACIRELIGRVRAGSTSPSGSTGLSTPPGSMGRGRVGALKRRRASGSAEADPDREAASAGAPLSVATTGRPVAGAMASESAAAEEAEASGATDDGRSSTEDAAPPPNRWAAHRGRGTRGRGGGDG